MKKWLDKYESKGEVKNSLNRTVTCSNCGWSWKLSDGGEDPLTCHKCGGTIKMKHGGELDEYKEKGEVKSTFNPYQQNKPIVDRGNFSNIEYRKSDQIAKKYENATNKRIAQQQLQQELSARKAKEKGTAFTLPTGATKKYKDMNVKERLYVDAQSLKNKSRWNENQVEQPFLNNFNPITMLYDMSAGLGEAPLMSDVTNSYMPYVTGVAAPLTAGALAGISANTTGQFVNNLVNPLAGTGEIFDNLGNKYLPNAYKINPLAFKTNSNSYYRMLGEDGLNDLAESQIIRSNQNTFFKNQNAYFSKGTPIDGRYYKSVIKGGNYNGPYMAEVKGTNEIGNRFARNRNAYYAPDKNIFVARDNISINNPNLKIYEQDWLRGYKPVNKNEIFTKGQPYEGAPHIHQDMYPINKIYHPRTVITDAGVKDEILGLEPTPIFPLNNVDYGLPLKEQFYSNKINPEYTNFELNIGRDIPKGDQIWNTILRKSHLNTENINLKGEELKKYLLLNDDAREEFIKNYKILKKQDGGAIITNRGQWDYPGQTTIIPSNKITMQGVPYPVLGVDNTGYTQMMQPQMDYTFPGQYVTEYPIMKHGGEMIKRADGSYSRRGLWDNIRANVGSGKRPTKEMLNQERKIRNQYQDGGEEDVYWRTKQPMVNDPSMDAISKVLLQRNQDKNFMQRAAGFGNQNSIPTRYIDGEDPNSNGMSNLLMGFGDNYVSPTIIETFPNFLGNNSTMLRTAPGQLSYQPKQKQEYIKAPTEDIADYFAAKGYKRAANDMYGMKYKNGGEEEINNLKNVNLNLPVYRKPEMNPLSFNKFLVNDKNQNLFIGGINPRYQNENFSVGPYMVGVGNKYFQKFPADMGMSGTYHVNDNFDINMGVGQNNVNAGIKYKFNNGGDIDMYNMQYQTGGGVPTVQGTFKKQNQYGYWVTDEEALAKEAQRLNSKRVLTEGGSLIIFDDDWNIVAADDNPDAPYKQGGSVTLNAGGENHRIYVKSTNKGEGNKGHIMVNHPTMDKGMWDTIDLTKKSGATTIAQGVAATKKWHMENPYMKEYGGDIPMYGPGGQNPPKVYTDPTAFNKASQSYTDSLNLYNYSKLQKKLESPGLINSALQRMLNADLIASALRKVTNDDGVRIIQGTFDELNKKNKAKHKNIAVDGTRYRPSQVSSIGNNDPEYDPLYKMANNIIKNSKGRIIYDNSGGSPDIISNTIMPKGIYNGAIAQNYDYSNTFPKQPVVYQPQQTINTTQGQITGNVRPNLIKGSQLMMMINPIRSKTNLKKLEMVAPSLNASNIQMKGQTIPLPQMQLKQQGTIPFYGPGNSIIGYTDDNMQFYPAQEYRGASSNELNLLDKQLLDNPEMLQKFVQSKDNYKFANGGGIPERYRNMGFTNVGAKKQSTRPGKKWMVLAKKGDDYKVVHGGYKGMQDFKQHHSEQRKENFWSRMGGRNSSKATDPFSPLYWHKRFGTWEYGGQPMAVGGQNVMNPIVKKDNRNWLEYLKN